LIFLNNDSKRLMTIVGRAGVGKTAMVCRLLKALERGELPDDLGEMKVDGIVYLSETGSHRVNFANVFADLEQTPAEGGDRRAAGGNL
jgi:nucleoside-triphosphatase THEP1